MEIAIERLNLRLSGDISPGRGRMVAGLLGEALQAALAPHGELLVTAPDGLRLPSLALLPLRTPVDPSDREIADLAATALAEVLLRHLEVA